MRSQATHELGTNFFDYRDDEEALIQEDEVAQALAERGCLFEDPAFPASAESLYRTPQQPPAGALPASLAVWGRVSQQEVRRCHTPVTFPNDRALAAVAQGALGDSWLVSALNMLAPFPDRLKNVVVSDRHSDKGVYTLKLFKEGTWRYLHLDDRLPCSPSRAPQYCSCKDSNQVWAPFIEKAFAKLHGCYESLGRGSIEQGLRSLTGAPLLRTSLLGLSPRHDLGEKGSGYGSAASKKSERHRLELWTKMKKWQERGCVMGCCRSVELDRVRNQQASYPSPMEAGIMTNGRRKTGLTVGLGYGILRVCEVSVEATRSHDAVSFKLVQLGCPRWLGHWQGAWSSESGFWERYPSVKTQLLPQSRKNQRSASSSSTQRAAVPVAGGINAFDESLGVAGARGGGGGGGEGGGGGGGGGESAITTPVRGESGEDASSFWMAFDDFAAEFSRVLTCVSYSDGQEARGLFRKSYRGRWIPGDPLTGSGGGCAGPRFLQNPFYPVTIQRNSTTVTVCLSARDRTWQADPSRAGPAIGYYVVRLTGSKPRLTKLQPSKVAARSLAFMAGAQAAGEHTFDSGRYAIVPVTVKPLASAEPFLLDLTANNTTEWEQTDDRFHDLDQELMLSDDEPDEPSSTGSKPGQVLPALLEEGVEREDFEGPPGNKVAEALHEQIADLSSLVAELQRESLKHSDALTPVGDTCSLGGMTPGLGLVSDSQEPPPSSLLAPRGEGQEGGGANPSHSVARRSSGWSLSARKKSRAPARSGVAEKPS